MKQPHSGGSPHGAQYSIRGMWPRSSTSGWMIGTRSTPPAGRQGQAGAKPPLQRQRSDHAPAAHGFPALSGGRPSSWVSCGPTTGPLFPHLLSQSPFHRRARQLWPWVEALRRRWAESLGATRASLSLLDTKPLPVVGDTRDKSRSDFAATAAYGGLRQPPPEVLRRQGGCCSAPRRGCPQPLRPGCRPARTSGVAGEQVLDWGLGASILGDKGFLGGRLATGLPGDPGPGDPDPLARQPAHDPARPASSGGLTACGERNRRGLPRSAEHRTPPGALDLQDAPRVVHACRGPRWPSHALKLLLRRQAGD